MTDTEKLERMLAALEASQRSQDQPGATWSNAPASEGIYIHDYLA